ncbi:MAG TPA: hypothetical protein VGQ30_01435, partial [Gemmatimonadaceae bacterium]|nr:hypothetical protein [Gemmatimonadaceae bacterium]
MFDRRLKCAVVTLWMAVAGTLPAQTITELLALKAKNDSALAAVELLKPAPAAPVAVAPELLDTARVGSVTLVSGKEAATLLRSAIIGASANVAHAFGDAGLRALAQTVVTGHLHLAAP